MADYPKGPSMMDYLLALTKRVEALEHLSKKK